MDTVQGGGCKWWHFYPDEGVAELEQKFQEIMSGQVNEIYCTCAIIYCTCIFYNSIYYTVQCTVVFSTAIVVTTVNCTKYIARPLVV